jgi:hypothetical protein
MTQILSDHLLLGNEPVEEKYKKVSDVPGSSKPLQILFAYREGPVDNRVVGVRPTQP